MRIEQLTFTRFLAALLIVVFHFGSGSIHFTNPYTQFIFKQANVGVSYFFMLSGFVMIIAYHKKIKIDFVDYIRNRFARIYPVYLLAIFLLFILSVVSKNLDVSNFFLNIFMIQAWIPGKALVFNVAAWSLAVELFFYMVFPFLFNHFYSKFKLKKLIIPIILFWIVSQIIFHYVVYQDDFLGWFYDKEDIMYHPVFHLNEFLVGNLAGLFFIKKSKYLKNYDWHIIGVITMVLLALKYPIGLNFHNGFLAILFIPLILLLSLNKVAITQLFNKKIFMFLGEISFGIYILQFIVWQYISDYRLNKYLGLDKVEDFVFCFFLRLFILIGLSAFSYLYIETPIRNKIRGTINAKSLNKQNV